MITVRCSCGAKNRVDPSVKGKKPKCGKCGATLSLQNKPKEIAEHAFDKEVLQSDIPVLVDFWAPWCGPCRMIAPVLEEVAGERSGAIKIVKINADKAPNLMKKYNIRGIPTLMIFKKGKQVNVKTGALPRNALLSWIDGTLR